MSAVRKEEQEDALEIEIDQALAERGGDVRATIRDLLVANAYLEAARDKAQDLVSNGFIRRPLQHRAQ